jgi:hypothetical protein
MMFAISAVAMIVIMAVHPVEIVGIGVRLKCLILKTIRKLMRCITITQMRSIRLSGTRDVKDVGEYLIS